MQKELQQQNWIRSLAGITTSVQLEQFTRLWAIMQDVVLLPRPDAIRWRWTESGVYSTASAYRCQFMGSCAPFRTAKFWKGHAEAKCRFFAWTALHGKILTADNLASPVREQVFAWNGRLGVPPPAGGKSLNDWWDETIAALPKEKRRAASGAIIYSVWGVWKERNRRVF